ncbi:MAG: hypothetical protein ACHQF0_02310 [Chitinophagales bacterium]
MKLFVLVTTALLFSFFSKLSAQDTLPKFSLKNAGNNRIIISWKNTYGLVKQISIQRSFDSLKNYKTILSVPDPMNRQNGYADTKAPAPNMYYRLFIVLDGSMFLFSNSKRPLVDSVKTSAETEQKKSLDPFSIEVNKPTKNLDSTLKGNGFDAKNKPNIWVPSIYLYTARDGNIHLNLPEADLKRYSVKFYDENNNFLFEVKDLKESSLILDKTNFFHSGWFKFELFADDKLKEKNKFYIEKEF